MPQFTADLYRTGAKYTVRNTRIDIYLERFVNDVMDRQVHRNGIFGQRMRKLTRTLLGCPALRYGGTHTISSRTGVKA